MSKTGDFTGTMSENNVLQFDPDELVLTKKDIMEMMDSIADRWKQDKRSNAKFIISIEAMKLGIRFTSEETLTKLWGEILRGFNELLYENAMAKAKGENEPWTKTLEKIKTKIKDDPGDRKIT